MRDIRPLVAPRSIAVIGASTNAQKSGGVLFHNLVRGDFAGPLYPINPNAAEVMGRKAYPSLADVPEKVDLVYIVLPRDHVEGAVRQCIAAGARAASIITAGFAEASEAGRVDQERIRSMAREAGLLLGGPNTIGMVNAECGMMGSFVNFPRWETGGVSLFTQTGIFTGALMLGVMSAETQRLPVGKSIDVGNKIDVDELDFLDFVADDPGTTVIGFYIETILRPAEFFAKAREIRKSKPIVMLKPGHTSDGARASLAHTGSRQAETPEIEAGIAESGIIRVEDECEFVDTLRTLGFLPRPKGRRVAVATTSGALGVMATDLVVKAGLTLSTFAPETVARMRTILPDWLPPENPFDFWIGIDVKGAHQAHEVGLGAIMADPNSDMVLCTLLAPGNADFPEFGPLMHRLRREHDKPIVLVVYGGAARERWIKDIEGAGIPVMRTTREGARALALLAQAAS
ncbi:CoA-binding protein [Rhodoplanes roseus]|uniref:Acyl-CoA synthetase n=1 Tax=Rhodoplanes roseus TaxID=29409 RepID=A0A327L1K2_9BRAD|nr:CoA-binding protein [Rhodoplanes roseus]RAI44829.1 acyl-CoA synthetase [Rhodoplanes roseus]